MEIDHLEECSINDVMSIIRNLIEIKNERISRVENDDLELINFYKNSSVQQRNLDLNYDSENLDSLPPVPVLLRSFARRMGFNEAYYEKLEALSNINIEYRNTFITLTTLNFTLVNQLVNNPSILINVPGVSFNVSHMETIYYLYFDGRYYLGDVMNTDHDRIYLTEGESNIESRRTYIRL